MSRRSSVVLLVASGIFGALTVSSTIDSTLAGPLVLAQVEPDPVLFAELMTNGERLYARNCSTCHGAEGQGAACPTLAGNEIMLSGMAVVTRILVGEENYGMPAFATQFNDDEIAAIATFVRNSWNNEHGIVRSEFVAQVRPE